MKLGLAYVGGWMVAHAVLVVFLAIGALAVRRAHDRRGLVCLGLFVAYIAYMATAGGDPPTAFPLWRQFVHVAPAWVVEQRPDIIEGYRRDFWETHPRRDTLDCVPVAETALAAFASR